MKIYFRSKVVIFQCVRSLGHELLGYWLNYVRIPIQSDLEEIIQRLFPVFRHAMNNSIIDAYNQSQNSILFRAVECMKPINRTENRPMMACPSEIYICLT
jgi:hypothetical protein